MIPDPLDVQLEQVRPAPRRGRRWAQTRPALGLSPTPLPGLAILPLGAALGPHGLGVLSSTLLTYLDPAVSVAIATLGVLVGLGLGTLRRDEGRLLGAASVEAALTMAFVAGGVLLMLRLAPASGDAWPVALILGICAAASSTTAFETADRPRARVARLGDLDDVLPIVIGGIAIASLRESTPVAVAWLAVASVGVALAIALAGWLLVAQSASERERRVFVLGTLLLLGGACEYLSLSALLTGLAAGALWSWTGDPAREHIGRDVRHVQHPLVVLLLLVAGARTGLPAGLAVVALAYLIFRALGKMLGGWIAGRVAARDLPPDVGLYLISPGVIAAAFALNALQAGASALVLAAAVMGSIGSELLSLMVHPREASS